jgi:hypothetical protein
MKYHEILYAVHKQTKEVGLFGCKYIPHTDTKPSRFMYQKTTPFFKGYEKAVTKEYLYSAKSESNADQLTAHLGEEWRVLSHADIAQAISNFHAQNLASV